MLYGEHLSAEEIAVQCRCGIAATVEVIGKDGQSHGWFCRKHADNARAELRERERLAKAIVRKRRAP